MKCMVNGKLLKVGVFDHLGEGKGDDQATRILFERMVRALNGAGFKYQHAYGRYGSLVADTEYKGRPVRFSVSVVKGGMEGYVMMPEHKMRAAGIVLVRKGKVNVIIDMMDDIPSMTLDL